MAIAPRWATASPRVASLRRHFWLASIAIVVLGASLAMFAGYLFIPAALALLLLCLCAYPAVRYLHERQPVVPAIPILTGAFAVQFALPVFLGDYTIWLVGGYKAIDIGDLIAALLIANVSMAAFLGIVYSRSLAPAIEWLPRVKLNLNRTRAVAFSVFFGLFVGLGSGVYASFSPDLQTQLAAIFRVLQTQMLIAIGVLAWLSYTSRSLWLRALYVLFVASAVVEGLAAGYLEAALAPVAIVFACEWIYRHRINKALVVALAVGMLLLNPVKAHYRDVVWFSSGPEASGSRVEKALFWVEAGAHFWAQVLKGEMHGEEAAAQLVKRASMIDLLAHVYGTTPDVVPYYMGETYSYFAYSLIPRLLWPEKPTATANRTLAVSYGLTTFEGAERSTFGVSLLGEGYANFGLWGSIGIMAVLALVLRALQVMFTTEQSGPGGYSLFLAFFIFFLNGLGSSAEILLGNLLQSMIVSSLIMYWVSEKPRPGARAP